MAHRATALADSPQHPLALGQGAHFKDEFRHTGGMQEKGILSGLQMGKLTCKTAVGLNILKHL